MNPSAAPRTSNYEQDTVGAFCYAHSSAVSSDSTLASWNGITASSTQINANVYNAAAFVSPLLSSTNTLRFLLLGGQAFTMTPPGAVSSTVYYNNAP